MRIVKGLYYFQGGRFESPIQQANLNLGKAYWIHPKVHLVQNSLLTGAKEMSVRNPQAGPEYKSTLPSYDSLQVLFRGLRPPAVEGEYNPSGQQSLIALCSINLSNPLLK